MQRDFNNTFIINNFNNISRLYYDESENAVILPVIKNKYDINILTASFINKEISIKKIFSFQKLYEALIDTVIVKSGIKFYHTVLTLNKNYIEEYKDGYRFCLYRSFVDSLFQSLSNNSAYKHLEGNVAYRKLALLLNNMFGDRINFENYDVYEIIHFFKRNNFYRENLWENKDSIT